MCAIITLGLYTFYPLFEVKKRFFKGLFFLKFWPYVWLVFKSGFKSGYRDARTVDTSYYHFGESNGWTVKFATSGKPPGNPH